MCQRPSLLTSRYEMVNSQHFGDAIRNSVVWRYVILDEGHKVKNEDTLVSQGMRRIQRQHVLLLTGVDQDRCGLVILVISWPSIIPPIYPLTLVLPPP